MAELRIRFGPHLVKALILLPVVAAGLRYATGEDALSSVAFSSYLGGSAADAATAVAVDPAGNVYVAGWTASTDLPVKHALQPRSGGGVDAFVAKYDPAGSLQFCTYLGGPGDDRATGISVDSVGNAYITGRTGSAEFPAGGARSAGGIDAFIVKLAATGDRLEFSRLIGGSGSDESRGIARDAAGYVYIAGETDSPNLPALHALQGALKGTRDAFVAAVNASGELVFCTYWGGSAEDGAAAIAVNPTGWIYVTGRTESGDMPAINAFQPVKGGGQDAFAVKFGPGGGTVAFSTFLGGSGGSVVLPEAGLAIDVDESGAVYVAGVTSSADFPTLNAYQPKLAGWVDAFVTRLSDSGSSLAYSTYLGGAAYDYGVALAVDGSGRACVAGYGTSADYPAVRPSQAAPGGWYDAYLTCLDGSGRTLISSTWMGGTGSDATGGLAMDAGFLYVAGFTASADFPVTGPTSLAQDGEFDGFTVKLNRIGLPPPAAPAPGYPAEGAAGISSSTLLAWAPSPGAASYDIHLGVTSPPPFLATTVTTSYTATGLTPGVTYYWSVAAKNGAGSATSAIRSFTTTPAAASGLQFYPITPCRVADTREFAGMQGPFGPPALPKSKPRSFPVRSSACTIPATAAAYSLNVTAVPENGYLGWLAIWGTGQPQPIASTLNAWGGTVTANAAIVPAGANGSIDVYASDSTHLILDINGYFAPPGPGGLQFYPVAPCRIADTRAFAGMTGAFGPPALEPANPRMFAVRSSPCGVPANASAYSLNVTVVPNGYLCFVTVWGAGQPQPVASTLNAWDGAVTANAAIVPAGADGAISIYASDNTDLLFDINGYFAPPGPGGLQFYPMTPCRVADTRAYAGTSGAFGPPAIGARSAREFPVLSSSCGLPPAAAVYALNVTVVPIASQLRYMTAWPAGIPTPIASTLNTSNANARANAAIVPAGAGGDVAIYASDDTDVIFDVNGYFAP